MLKNNFLKTFLRNFFFLGIILLILEGLGFIILDKYISVQVLSIITVCLGSYWIFEKLDKKKHASHLKYIFLLGLFLIFLSSLNIQFLESWISLITTFTIGIGALIVLLHKKSPELFKKEDSRKEKLQTWFFTNKRIEICLIILITATFFITRLYNNEFINGSDNYNLLGVKNLYENGVNFYKSSTFTDTFNLLIAKLFGFNFFTIKLPYILYSFITLIFIFLISKKIDKTLAFLASFLYSISPWAIIVSRITRDYSFDLMVATITIYLSFVIYEKAKETKNIKHFLKYLGIYITIPLTIFLLYKFNRAQTLVAGVYTVFPLLFLIPEIFNKKTLYKRIYFILAIIFLITGLYFIDYRNHTFGYQVASWEFFEMFFSSKVESPWQWFHNINITPLLPFSILLLGGFSLKKGTQNQQRLLLLLLLAFFFSLFLFEFKFNSHLEYIPTRYIYFLFAPYVILISNGILNIIKPFSILQKLLILLFMFSLINYTAIVYSINPRLAYEKEKITNLKIDNVGIGRFELLNVIYYLLNGKSKIYKQRLK